MKRSILAVALVAFSGISNASFDYTCLNECADAGNTFQFCTAKCTTHDLPAIQQPAQSGAEPGTAPEPQVQNPTVLTPHTDPSCLNDCSNDGYKEEFCQQRCTF